MLHKRYRGHIIGDRIGKSQYLKGNGREPSRIAERSESSDCRSIMMLSSINKGKFIPTDTINQVQIKSKMLRYPEKYFTVFHLC